MAVTVSYRPFHGWLTIFVSPYITWQGHISDVPEKYEQYLDVGSYQ